VEAIGIFKICCLIAGSPAAGRRVDATKRKNMRWSGRMVVERFHLAADKFSIPE
jgi:hypothetical protein